jgi:hypothetical protein
MKAQSGGGGIAPTLRKPTLKEPGGGGLRVYVLSKKNPEDGEISAYVGSVKYMTKIIHDQNIFIRLLKKINI